MMPNNNNKEDILKYISIYLCGFNKNYENIYFLGSTMGIAYNSSIML